MHKLLCLNGCRDLSIDVSYRSAKINLAVMELWSVSLNSCLSTLGDTFIFPAWRIQSNKGKQMGTYWPT